MSQRYCIIRVEKKVADEGRMELPALCESKLKWKPSAVCENFLPVLNILYVFLMFISDINYRGYNPLYFFYVLDKADTLYSRIQGDSKNKSSNLFANVCSYQQSDGNISSNKSVEQWFAGTLRAINNKS